MPTPVGSSSFALEEAEARVRTGFDRAGVTLVDLAVRRYPEETIFIATVPVSDLESAARTGNELDVELANNGFDGFVTVKREVIDHATRPTRAAVSGVHDRRCEELIRLLQARARTSESQPSLMYVPDSAATIASATAARHHLIFGRRGAGKTALLLEAKSRVEDQGAFTAWINLQPYRWMETSATAAAVVQSLLSLIKVHFSDTRQTPQVLREATSLGDVLSAETARHGAPNIRVLLPQVQSIVHRFTQTTGRRLYLFLDDYYFVPRVNQVELLDMLHACVRDSDAWLKIATIRHLTRWFDPSSQLGMQVGHDVDALDLDVTLQEPKKAKAFLETVLRQYAENVDIGSLTRVFKPEALDRLVLASGSVPRDFLILSSNALSRAQQRRNARTVGVQDVNKVAGDASQLKIQELDEDLSANGDWALRTREAFDKLLAFCLDDVKWTFFSVDFRDREAHPEAYDLLTSLMDLRMVHLLNPSISDERKAGEKSEVYLLDLSQYSGERLKKYLHILDFVSGNFVLKETGVAGDARVGKTPKLLIAILRRAPSLSLRRLL